MRGEVVQLGYNPAVGQGNSPKADFDGDVKNLSEWCVVCSSIVGWRGDNDAVGRVGAGRSGASGLRWRWKDRHSGVAERGMVYCAFLRRPPSERRVGWPGGGCAD